MTDPDHRVTVGVDTHLDTHVAAAFNHLGRPLGHLEIPTTAAGYRRLLRWARSLGSDVTFGIEGTGSFGAGLARSCGLQAVPSSRSTGRIVKHADRVASPTPSTPSPPPEPSSPARPLAPPSPMTTGWG